MHGSRSRSIARGTRRSRFESAQIFIGLTDKDRRRAHLFIDWIIVFIFGDDPFSLGAGEGFLQFVERGAEQFRR